MYNTAKLAEAMNEYLQEELEAKRVWRVVEQAQRNGVVLSPFGLIPKKVNQGSGD